jgi:hypothetical protein
MPDIEFFGQINESDVRFILRDAPYLNTLSFIRHNAVVRTHANIPDRFIRLVLTNQFPILYRKDLIKRLRSSGCGVEVVNMEAYYEPE